MLLGRQLEGRRGENTSMLPSIAIGDAKYPVTQRRFGWKTESLDECRQLGCGQRLQPLFAHATWGISYSRCHIPCSFGTVHAATRAGVGTMCATARGALAKGLTAAPAWISHAPADISPNGQDVGTLR